MKQVVPLSGAWQFREKGASEWKAGQVPGCVQSDLIRLGELPDPSYRLREVECHRLEDKEWVYRKEFEWNANDVQGVSVQLVFEGIDTLADVYLNGTFLGRVEDMFLSYRYEVGDYLVPGRNVIEVHFDSPVRLPRTLAKNSPVPLVGTPEFGRPYIRKAQYSYGWDWGPRITPTGLWRPVYLEVLDGARIDYPFFETDEIAGNSAKIRLGAEVEVLTEKTLHARVSISLNGERVVSGEAAITERLGKKIIEWRGEITHPRLWYPNGLGDQPLYDVTLSVLHGEKVLDERSFRAGIRTVRLLREKDAQGESFVFVVNGVKVFAKGANWIPADNFLPRVTPEDYRYYVRLAKDANMNMLRVWGGGIYEDRAFYEACDENGIMVWQDFMFACAQYPDHLDWFRELAEREAEHVVKTLRRHPSIVLWCGNNENNWGFFDWWGNGGEPTYYGNYLYQQVFPKVCSENDPSRPYWASSPYGGNHPNSTSAGDRHTWDVWSGWQDYRWYLGDTGRFISEFGFQALPDYRTILSFTEPEDRHPLSPVMRGHNKMVEGTERLVRFVVGRLGFPKDFKSFVYLTQFNQAEAIRTGVEHWRSRKFATAGTLYWQFNDCWPVASWSCIDHSRRKKALYYYSRRFYQPVLAVLKYEEDQIALYAVNDLLKDVVGVVRLTAYGLDGTRKGEKVFSVRIMGNSAAKLAVVDPGELGIGYTAVVGPVDADTTTFPRERNGELLDTVVFVELDVDGTKAHNYLVFDVFRNLELSSPTISLKAEKDAIQLVADKPAFGVFLETTNDVELGDNCLNMEPGVAYTVRVEGDPGEVIVRDLTSMTQKLY